MLGIVHDSSIVGWEVLAGVLVAGIVAVVGFLIKKFWWLFGSMAKVVNLLVTREPSEFEPHPSLGMIDQTTANTEAVLTMSVRHSQSNGTMKGIQADLTTVHTEITD